MARQLLLTAAAFALFGLSKVVFNLLAIHRLDAVSVADLNTLIALQTVAVVLLTQPVAATIHRFSTEHLVRSEVERACRLLSSGLLVTLVAGLSGSLLVALLDPWLTRELPVIHAELVRRSSPFLAGYALYFLFKMAYFGFGRVPLYCVAETIASGGFFAALGVAAWVGSPSAYLVPWIVHPALFVIVASWHFRKELRWPVGPRSLSSDFPRYASYGGYWLISAVAGFGTYHLSILFAKRFVSDPLSVGYYCVALALLTPLNFLPMTITMVLMPQMTTNFARGTRNENARMLFRSTSALVLLLTWVTVALLTLCPEILILSNIPDRLDQRIVFQLLAISVALALVSVPSGSFFAATDRAETSAALGVATLLGGIACWLIMIPRIGHVGVALGYAVVMSLKGCGNILLSHRRCSWIEGHSWRYWLLPLPLSLAAVAGLAAWSLPTRLLLLGLMTGGVAVALWPVLGELARGLRDAHPRLRAMTK